MCKLCELSSEYVSANDRRRSEIDAELEESLAGIISSAGNICISYLMSPDEYWIGTVDSGLALSAVIYVVKVGELVASVTGEDMPQSMLRDIHAVLEKAESQGVSFSTKFLSINPETTVITIDEHHPDWLAENRTMQVVVKTIVKSSNDLADQYQTSATMQSDLDDEIKELLRLLGV